MIIKKHLPLISITFAGLLLRLYHLTSISLWHDEAFSALLIRYNWGEMMRRIALDVHPPMYYIALRFWHYIFADSLWSLRGFSLTFSVGTIIVACLLVKKAFGSEKFALLAALLLALNPFQVQFVSQARMYTFGAFFSLLAAYFLVSALQLHKASKRGYPLYYVFFGVSCGIIILTHYYLLFTAAALCFYGLAYHFYYYRGSLKKYGWLILSYAIMIAMFLPWLKIFLFQYKQVGSDYWIPPMDRWSIPDTLWHMLIGTGHDLAKTASQILVVLAAIFSLYIICVLIKKFKDGEKWLVILSLAAPFAGSILFFLMAKIRGEQSSVYLLRYFIFASSFYTIVLAGWLTGLKRPKPAACLLIIYCLVNLWGVYRYWKSIDVETKPGLKAASAYLEANVGPKDKLYVGNNSIFFSFSYYNRTQKIPLLYSAGKLHAADLPHYYGTALLNDSDLIPDLKAAALPGDTVWMLWTDGFYDTKPPTPTNWTQIDEQSYGEISFYTAPYRIYVLEYKVN